MIFHLSLWVLFLFFLNCICVVWLFVVSGGWVGGVCWLWRRGGGVVWCGCLWWVVEWWVVDGFVILVVFFYCGMVVVWLLAISMVGLIWVWLVGGRGVGLGWWEWLRKRETKRRDGRGERWLVLYLYYYMGSLYYCNEFYEKIETKM